MQYTIIGRAELPDPVEPPHKHQCPTDEVFHIEVPIQYRNLQLDKAKTLVMDRLQGGRKGAADKNKSAAAAQQNNA